MTFGASTFIWVSPFSDDTLYLFDKARSLGFDTLEICIENPETINTAAIKTVAEQTNMNILICGAFGPTRDISSTDPAIRQNGLDYLKTCIDITDNVGANMLSGPMYSATGKTNLLSKQEKHEQWSYAVENIQSTATYAAASGIKLAVEPLNRFETDFINTVDQAMNFLSRVDMDNVGLLLDTFHMNIEEIDIAAAIRRAGSKLFNFHACSNDRGTPGRDHINWPQIKTALADISYDGCMVIESFNPGITEIARAVSLWRKTAESPDALAQDGIVFLKSIFGLA